MAGTIQWNGDEIRRKVREQVVKNLAAAAVVVQSHAKELLSVSGVGVNERLARGRAKRLAVRALRKKNRAVAKSRDARKAHWNRFAKLGNKGLHAFGLAKGFKKSTAKRWRVTGKGTLTTARRAKATYKLVPRKRRGT